MILRAPLGNTSLQGFSRFVGFVGGGCSGLTFSDLLPVSEAGPGDAAALSDATSARAPPLLLLLLVGRDTRPGRCVCANPQWWPRSRLQSHLGSGEGGAAVPLV